MIIMAKNLVQLVMKKKFNPRLQVRNVDEYVELMSNLNLSKPELMEFNIKKNTNLGKN